MIAIILLQNISGLGLSELGQERCFWCSKFLKVLKIEKIYTFLFSKNVYEYA
jgi:hypothetical protein